MHYVLRDEMRFPWDAFSYRNAGNASFTDIDRQEYILDRGVCAESGLSSKSDAGVENLKRLI